VRFGLIKTRNLLKRLEAEKERRRKLVLMAARNSAPESRYRPQAAHAHVVKHKKRARRGGIPKGLAPYVAFMRHFKRAGKKAEVMRWMASQR
jgi:hypothetical protein